MTRIVEWEERDSDYQEGARYKVDAYHLIGPGAKLSREERISILPELLRSPEPLDRILARTYLYQLHATLPPVWVVVETEDSPNLNRTPPTLFPYDPLRQAWSAHVDREQADAWCAVTQQNSDAQVAKNGWGEGSRRTFAVQLLDGVDAQYLRKPGSDPAVYCTAFTNR